MHSNKSHKLSRDYSTMAKPELGTKRIDPETGKKFYDLGRDPIISPYTGISYPRSYFDETVDLKEEGMEEEGIDTVLEKPEFISLDEVDDEEKADDLPDIGDDDVDLSEVDDDTFLADDDSDDDVVGILGDVTSDDDL